MCSLSAIVLGLSVWWYGQVDLAQPNLATCLADPARHAGQVIIIDRESKITAVRPGGALEVTESGLGQDVRCRLEGASGDLGTLRFQCRPESVQFDRHRVRQCRHAEGSNGHVPGACIEGDRRA